MKVEVPRLVALPPPYPHPIERKRSSDYVEFHTPKRQYTSMSSICQPKFVNSPTFTGQFVELDLKSNGSGLFGVKVTKEQVPMFQNSPLSKLNIQSSSHGSEESLNWQICSNRIKQEVEVRL